MGDISFANSTNEKKIENRKYLVRYVPDIWKYWRSLNLAISARSGCNLILADIKFGGCTARTKHSK